MGANRRVLGRGRPGMGNRCQKAGAHCRALVAGPRGEDPLQRPVLDLLLGGLEGAHGL